MQRERERVTIFITLVWHSSVFTDDKLGQLESPQIPIPASGILHTTHTHTQMHTYIALHTINLKRLKIDRLSLLSQMNEL